LFEPGFRLGDRLALVLALGLIADRAFAIARAMGSSKRSSMPMAAGPWLGDINSINLRACCLSAAMTRYFTPQSLAAVLFY
jgi:hypothetical protein